MDCAHVCDCSCLWLLLLLVLLVLWLTTAPAPAPALKGASFRVVGGERLGVVGRTGAGKSTLAAALFRLVSVDAGCVRIDGMNIAKVPLRRIRGSAVCIIPQVRGACALLSGAAALCVCNASLLLVSLPRRRAPV